MTAGWFWGWLYYRQGSLFGVIVSHILVGWCALFIRGLERIDDMQTGTWISWYPFGTHSNAMNWEVPTHAGTSYIRIRSE